MRRQVLIMILGNVLLPTLLLSIFMACVFSGATPIGELSQYTQELYGKSLDAHAIAEDPQFITLLKRFQFFWIAFVVPVLAIIVAFLCAFMQRERRLLFVCLATVPVPAFFLLSYYYSNMKFIMAMGFDLRGLMPLISFSITIVGIYLAYKIVHKRWNNEGTDPPTLKT